MKKILILLFLIPINLLAHKDRTFISNVDNITLKFTTGRNTEEIQSSKFIAKYAAMLSKALSYNKEIYIDLVHDYMNWRNPNSFISINRCSNEYWYHDTIKSNSDKKNRIIITDIQHKFNISNILKLIEFAIKNESMIKNSSQLKAYTRYNKKNDAMNYHFLPTPVPIWDYSKNDFVADIDSGIMHKTYANRTTEVIYGTKRSIDSLTIINCLSQKQSATLNKILNIKLIKSNSKKEKDTTFSYYTQNNKYHVSYVDKDSIFYLASFDHIHRLIPINKFEVFVFTSHNEFQNIIISFVKKLTYNIPQDIQVSKKFKINNDKFYFYLDVKEIEYKTYLIFQHGEEREIALYFFDNKVIPDFQKILDELKISN